MLRIFLKLFNKVYYLFFKGSKTGLRKRTLAVAIFAIAMAYIEASVVVYLREIYFPDGFSQPFRMFSGTDYWIEFGREISTIVMLLCIGYIMGYKFQDRFAFFMFAFGIWDIFYYLWLKLFINWPSSLLTWDLLFLVPVPWTGPILAPVLISVSLISAAIATVYYKEKGVPVHLRLLKWSLEGVAGVIIITSFIWNYSCVLHAQEIKSFPWWIFFTGFFLGWAVFISEIIRIKRLNIPNF